MKIRFNRQFSPWYESLSSSQKVFVWLSFLSIFAISIWSFFLEPYNPTELNPIGYVVFILIIIFFQIIILFTVLGLPLGIIYGLCVGMLNSTKEFYADLGKEFRKNQNNKR